MNTTLEESVVNFTCRICGNSESNHIHTIREMMYGTRETFNYIECSHCECLQIYEIPPNLEKHYPTDYYSYQLLLDIKAKFKLILKAFIFNNNLHHTKFLKNKTSLLRDCGFLDVLHQNNYLNFNSKILDVGCGCGRLLLQLKYIGFKHLNGIDPFIKLNIDYGNGVSIEKSYLNDLDQHFDLIMLHHSFEHMGDPASTLESISRRLSENGFALIRIPIVPCFAWQHYGVNWVQLDAPRHLYIHSIKSMEILAEQAGLKIVNISFDSNEFQFYGSEQYIKDIPLTSQPDGSLVKNIVFTQAEIEKYKNMAKKLNEENQGDQACLLLRRK